MATTTTSIASDIKNFELADLGKKRIEWANQSMKVLQIIRKEFIKNQPLKGIRVSACLHVTAETANLAITCATAAPTCAVRLQPALHAGRRGRQPGARLQHSRLRHQGRGQRHLLQHIMAALDHKPHITMDDGADLVTVLHTKRKTRSKA
jgi:adenosylhomocysteinase